MTVHDADWFPGHRRLPRIFDGGYFVRPANTRPANTRVRMSLLMSAARLLIAGSPGSRRPSSRLFGQLIIRPDADFP